MSINKDQLCSLAFCYKAFATEGVIPGYELKRNGDCCMCLMTCNPEDRCDVSEQCCVPYHPGCDLEKCTTF